MSRAKDSWKHKARQNRLTRIARIMSGELENVGATVKKVILNHQGRASTDGKNVYIPADYGTGNEALELMIQEATLAHEAAGHMRYTQFEDWHNLSKSVKAGDDDQLIHDFVNILEDARVNHLLGQDFPGSGKRLAISQEVFKQRHQADWERKDSADESLDPQAAIVAMMTEAIIHEPHFNTDRPQVVAYMDEVRSLLNNAIAQPDTKAVIKQARRLVEVFRTYWPGFDSYGEQMGDGGEGIILDDMSAEEVEKMAKAQKEQGVKAEKVSKKRFQDMEKAEKPEATETPDNGSESTDEGEEAQDSTEGDGEDDNGNAGESGEGEDGADGEANGEAEDGNGLDHEGVAKENREQEFDMEGSEADALFAELTEAIDLEAQQAVDLEHDFKEEAGEVAEQMDDTRIKHHEIQITHTTEELVDKGVEDVERWEDEYNQTIKQHKTQITTMKNELRRLIKGRNTKYTDGLKRGDLDDRKLWQARTTDRLFKKRDQPKRAEANVLILVDASGSMGCGTRATSASECAAVITEVMDDLGFGCEVVDFNSGGSNRGGYTNVRVRKSMKAPLNRITKAAIRSPYVGSENSDGYAVQWSLDRLQQFKGNRILFVISDGQPCGPYDSTHSNASAHLKAVVANAPKDIALFSIGIDGMDTSKFYPNGASCNAHELTTKAMPIIRKMLRKVKAV